MLREFANGNVVCKTLLTRNKIKKKNCKINEDTNLNKASCYVLHFIPCSTFYDARKKKYLKELHSE